MTGFLVNLLSPVFSSLGVSQADLTSYIEKLIGYVIAILALLVVMIVVMVVAHKAKKGFRHVIRWQAAIAFIAIVAVLVNVICYGPMYNNVSSVLNAKKVVLAQETTDQSRATIQKVAEKRWYFTSFLRYKETECIRLGFYKPAVWRNRIRIF